MRGGVLRVRAFRHYFAGQSLGQLGAWAQIVAEGWLALQVTDGSAFGVGLASAARFIPIAVFAPWIGLLVDRVNRRRLLLYAQLSMSLVALMLFALAATGTIGALHLYLLCFLGGTASALEMATRHAFVVDLSGPANAGSAIALNGASFNLSRIVGPLVAGILITNGHLAVSFLVNALTYLFAVANLHRIRRVFDPPPAAPEPGSGDLLRGARYILRTPEVGLPIALLGWCTVGANNFTVVLPLVAQRSLHGDASTYSWLMAATSAGALLGVPFAASRPSYSARLIAWSSVTLGIAMAVASLAPSIAAMAVAMAFVGAAELLLMTAIGTLVQLRTDPVVRGRVLALRQVVGQGSVPVGSMLAALVVSWLGPRAGLAMGAVAGVSGAVLFTFLTRRHSARSADRTNRVVAGRDGGAASSQPRSLAEGAAMTAVRPDLDPIPEYQPGRQASPTELEAAGIAQLSSNEAPWAPPESVALRIEEAVAILNRYPSMSSTDLRTVLAARFGVDLSQVVVGAGGVEIGRQAATSVVRPGAEVVYATPSFPDYEILTRINGGTPVPVPLDAEAAHDLPAMVAAVTERTRMFIVCNPNNPTGTGVRTEEIRAAVRDLPPDVLVLVDEAYWEFSGADLGDSAVSLVADHPNVVVLRTFSKAYGLAAVRVGYGIASGEIASAMRKVQLPFSVNGLAEAAALAVLADEEHVLSGIALVRAERETMRARLLELGFQVPVSHGNFLWIDGEPGQEIVRRCEADGVAVRTLGPRGGRITIGTPADNQRVLASCEAAAKTLGLTAPAGA